MSTVLKKIPMWPGRGAAASECDLVVMPSSKTERYDDDVVDVMSFSTLDVVERTLWWWWCRRGLNKSFILLFCQRFGALSSSNPCGLNKSTVAAVDVDVMSP